MLLIFASACQLTPTRFSKYNQGSWEAKSLIKDKKNKKTFIVKLNFKAIRDQAYRVDVFSPLGSHEASLLYRPGQLEMLDLSNKKFYRANNGEKLFSKALSVNLEPSSVFSILFDEPISSEGWACGFKKTEAPNQCKNKKQGIEVVWSERINDKKTVEITHPNGEVQILFTSFNDKVAQPEKAFQLKIPKSFKTFKLRE